MNSHLTCAAAALRIAAARFPWVHPTEEEAEVADLLDELAALHVRTGGRCKGCAEPWPCRGLAHAEHLAVQWLGRAADRVYARHRHEPQRLGELLPGAVADLTARQTRKGTA